MNEDEVNVNDQNEDVWQPPPLPEEIVADEIQQPEMSEAGTLGNIFIEPGRTFKDLRIKPRFILAGLLMVFAIASYQILFTEKIGYETIAKARLDASPQVQQMSKEQKEAVYAQQTAPVFKYVGYVAAPVVFIIIFFLGGLIYWLAIKAFGGNANYLHGVSTWIYSSLPPTILFVLINTIVLFLKPVEEIDLVHSQGNLAPTNLGYFVSATDSPVLSAVLSSFDILSLWGWILAVIGLKVVGKISTASALTITVILALISVTARVVMALIF